MDEAASTLTIKNFNLKYVKGLASTDEVQIVLHHLCCLKAALEDLNFDLRRKNGHAIHQGRYLGDRTPVVILAIGIPTDPQFCFASTFAICAVVSESGTFSGQIVLTNLASSVPKSDEAMLRVNSALIQLKNQSEAVDMVEAAHAFLKDDVVKDDTNCFQTVRANSNSAASHRSPFSSNVKAGRRPEPPSPLDGAISSVKVMRPMKSALKEKQKRVPPPERPNTIVIDADDPAQSQWPKPSKKQRMSRPEAKLTDKAPAKKVVTDQSPTASSGYGKSSVRRGGGGGSSSSSVAVANKDQPLDFSLPQARRCKGVSNARRRAFHRQPHCHRSELWTDGSMCYFERQFQSIRSRKS